MPKARNALISLEATPYYHCISRCVRRSFLCGHDPLTGNSYEHRRQWAEDRLIQLTQVFAIDLCAYAIMSNHSHVVLKVNESDAKSWTEQQVIERWHRLYAGNQLSQRFMAGESLGSAEQRQLSIFVETWRERLYSISWFMRNLNEHIARRANQEDSCTGRFWEGRFKSQALLDEKALAACMVYVDLNPIRAKMADTPETSDHTSVKARINAAEEGQQPNHLLPFVGYPRRDMPEGLPFKLKDYLDLVDWSGKIVRDDKRGAIDHLQPPILERLAIEPKQWKTLAREFEQHFCHFVGSASRLRQTYEQLGYRRHRGISASSALLSA